MGDKSPVGKKGPQPSSPKAPSPIASSPKGGAAEALSPKADSAPASSPKEGTPTPAAAAEILPAQHWVQAAEDGGLEQGDAASIAETVASSTNSLTSSILEYRKVHGRTYHSDVGNAEYWGANDERQNESMDIMHHALTLELDGKLFLAPLETDGIQKVLDIGTGTGTWAIDFADDHPNVEVIGTDISPIQPGWIPPNLKFEIEDCTREWTFQPESFDYIHIRWLMGSIADWDALYAEAYRTLRPGGWIESHEGGGLVSSDDGSVPPTSAMGQWGRLFINFGNMIGRSAAVVYDRVQPKGIAAAGFVDIKEVDYKTPVGNWPKDPKLKEIGECVRVAMATDIEGYIMYPATALGWSPEEVSVYSAHVRREMRDPNLHGYYHQKVVYGRKPL